MLSRISICIVLGDGELLHADLYFMQKACGEKFFKIVRDCRALGNLTVDEVADPA
ncbi:hypothetical protein OH686_23025 [Pseudomonas sp. SO81]|nr:hypothetical protein OH686_23025 [Pseudomonas sp. SO81]